MENRVEENAGQARTKDAGHEPELGLLSRLNFTGIFSPLFFFINHAVSNPPFLLLNDVLADLIAF